MCAGTLIYVAIRIASLTTSLRLSGEAVTADIQENGKRIETIKAIQTIKVMSAEAIQQNQWTNSYADVFAKTFGAARFNITVAMIHQSFDAIVSTLVIYLGARAIVAGEMTVGILYAFMAYKGQFSGAIANVVEQIIEWKLSDIYSYRLADIVLTPKEAGIDKTDTAPIVLQGAVEVENLAFRYSPYDPLVFRNLSFSIKPGEFVAIVGPSGVGKSSLLKLLCGLYHPSSGEIRIDGRPLTSWNPKTLRGNFGVVLQDDEVLSGTIAENVAFFDEQTDMDRVWQALQGAALRAEVEAMPMKAETFVGDMGGALSGGQKQRLFIARALYRDPKLLLMDEATSHLDRGNEELINQELKKMNVTRIVIAHRQETIRSADRIFDMATGKFVSLQCS